MVAIETICYMFSSPLSSLRFVFLWGWSCVRTRTPLSLRATAKVKVTLLAEPLLFE
jgi:hypothetical protein